MKILVLALSGIGDALMFSPAIQLMKKSRPDLQIDVLVMFKGSEDVIRNNPEVNNLIRFDFIKEGFLKSLNFLFILRKKYDATINVYPSNRKEYNIINFLLGAGKRAGVKYKRKNFSNFGFLNNVTIEEDDSVHNVVTNIRLCGKLLNINFNEEPALKLNLNEFDLDFADRFINENRIGSNDLVVGFHPGCGVLKNHIKRRWEPEKFAGLAKKLIEDYKAIILLFGGPDEQELKEKIAGQINSERVMIINSETITQSSAIMTRCNVFVTNDSSQMHIASALKLKTVAIIGPTNPAYIHPWKTEHEIVTLNLDCSPCFFYSPKPLICYRTDLKFKCIKELTVDMVFDSVRKFIIK
jgi:lipopolysaccharide heptosyltransferase II